MSIFGGGGKPTARSWESEDFPTLPLEDVDQVAELVDQVAEVVDPAEDSPPVKPRRRKTEDVDQVAELAEVVGDVDKRLRVLARQVRTERKRLATAAIRIGESLAEAQALLADYGNGKFTKWLDDCCGIGRRTAYDYIACFKVFGACAADSQARFELTAMVKLAAESAPAAARAEALELAASRQAVTTKTARALIAKHSPTKPAKTDRPKTLSVVVHGGAVTVRHKPGEDPLAILEAAAAELRRERTRAAA